MNPILNKNLFFVKEHRGIFKAANNYDIFDPNTTEMIMTCREEKLGFISKMLRFSKYKQNTPFEIEIRTTDGNKVLTVKRGVSIFLSNIQVLDENDILVGRFKQKFFSIGGKFDVLDAADNVVCSLRGKWTSWNFDFSKGDVKLAHVAKKWAGLGKEMFTSADNYMLEIEPTVPENDPVRLLVLAAVMCIDMVLKE